MGRFQPAPSACCDRRVCLFFKKTHEITNEDGYGMRIDRGWRRQPGNDLKHQIPAREREPLRHVAR